MYRSARSVAPLAIKLIDVAESGSRRPDRTILHPALENLVPEPIDTIADEPLAVHAPTKLPFVSAEPV